MNIITDKKQTSNGHTFNYNRLKHSHGYLINQYTNDFTSHNIALTHSKKTQYCTIPPIALCPNIAHDKA